MTKRAALFLLPTDTMGGAENVIRMIAAAALKSGEYERITVFVLAGQPSGTLDALRANGADIVHSGAASEKAGLLALARTLGRERYALVMASHTHLNAAASAARRLGLLCTDRLVTRESTMAFERDLGRKGPLIRGLYRLYGTQDRIVCQTERMAQSLHDHTGGKFHPTTRHVANPIDLDLIAADTSLTAPPFSIVWCGRLAPVKSPDRAIATLVELRALGVDATLTMVGDGPSRSALRAQAIAAAVDDLVTFTGRVERPSELMRECSLGLMTSDIEGFPNVILEMLASGVRRVVTTDCAGGLADIPGVTVSSSEPPALAAALRDASADASSTEIADYLAARTPCAFLEAIAS